MILLACTEVRTGGEAAGALDDTLLVTELLECTLVPLDDDDRELIDVPDDDVDERIALPEEEEMTPVTFDTGFVVVLGGEDCTVLVVPEDDRCSKTGKVGLDCRTDPLWDDSSSLVPGVSSALQKEAHRSCFFSESAWI